MVSEDRPPKPPPLRRSARRPPAASTSWKPNRLAFRLLGIPVLAVAGVFLYRGLHEHFVLPECDSTRATKTLAEIFKQLEMQPLHYEPIKNVSTSKTEVVCNALLPLAEGGSVNIDYRFFWRGSATEMRYSISRRRAQGS